MIPHTYFPKVTHTRALFRCPKCRTDTLGRWRTSEGELVRPNLVSQIFGTILIGWREGRVINIQSQQKLVRRPGCYEIRIYEDKSFDIWSLQLDEPKSPRGHFCEVDVEVSLS